MIEEVPESSWAAVKIPTKPGNIVFNSSKIADKLETVQDIKVKTPPPLTHITPSELNDQRNEEEEEVYVNANLFPFFKFG